jgi:hypothetical protein
MVPCIGRLYRIDTVGGQIDTTEIAVLSKRMGMYHTTAVPLHALMLGVPVPGYYIGVFQEPLLIKAVDQVIVAVIGFFPTEKYIQAILLTLISGFLIAAAKLVYPFPPGKPPVKGGISAVKMVGYDDARIPLINITLDIIAAASIGAGAGLTGMQMGFV